MMDADLVLLQRFSMQGDEEAFAEIVRRYAGLVFSTSYRVLADRARAEEVAQETFLRLAQKPYSVTRSVAGWLHRAATQLAIDVHRSDVARARREQEFATTDRPTQSWAEVSPLVDRALEEMPDEPRTLLIKHFLEGRTQQVIAAERGVSAATLSRQMKAAVELLREKLGRHGIWAQGTVLALWLTHHVAREAPATLLRELGKMSLVSPTVREAAPVVEKAFDWNSAWISAKRSLPLVGRVAALVVLLLVLTWPAILRWKAKEQAVPVEHEPDPPAVTSREGTAMSARPR